MTKRTRASRLRPRMLVPCAAVLGGCGGGGEGASSVAESPSPWFEEVSRASGLEFTYCSGHGESYRMPEIMGGGAALFDADGDGDLDAYLVQGECRGGDGPPAGNRLFLNRGAGDFEDVSAESGADHRGYGMGVACGDYDADGDADLYVTNVGSNALLANVGEARFEDVTAAADAGHSGWGTSAGFFDYDRDGLLDLYVCNYIHWSEANEIECRNSLGRPDYCSPETYRAPTSDVLYHNLGGRFEDVSESTGVSAELGNGLGLGPGDFDEDGWCDVFVANDGNPDFLWKNEGGKRFVDVAAISGCAVDLTGAHKAGMGVAVEDIDGDLDLDLLVCNLNRESDSLFVNEGGRFQDRTGRGGLASVSRPFTRFGMGWVDFDHDGSLDLFQANGRVSRLATLHSEDPYAEPNLLFRGLPGGRFREVRPRGGTSEPLVATSRAAAFGDVDGDGAVDVLVVNRDAPAHLLANRAASGRWVILRVLESSGWDALGASVELRLAGRSVRRDVRAAYSYLASNDPSIHVGLGSVERIRGIEVTWADGARESFGPFAVDRRHVLRRGEGRAPER